MIQYWKRWESGVARSCTPSANFQSLAHKYCAVYYLPATIPSAAAISNSAKYLDGFHCCFVSRSFSVSNGRFQAVFRQVGVSKRTTEPLQFAQQLFHVYSIVADAGLLQLALDDFELAP